MSEKAMKVPAISHPPVDVIIERLDPRVEPIIYSGGYSIGLPIFALTEDGRPRKVQIPTKDARYVNTKYKIVCPEHVMPMLFSSQYLIDNKLEALSYTINEESEFLVRVHSFAAMASYLEHGRHLCNLTFVNQVVISLIQ